jgi:hypothetical protein
MSDASFIIPSKRAAEAFVLKIRGTVALPARPEKHLDKQVFET